MPSELEGLTAYRYGSTDVIITKHSAKGKEKFNLSAQPTLQFCIMPSAFCINC